MVGVVGPCIWSSFVGINCTVLFKDIFSVPLCFLCIDNELHSSVLHDTVRLMSTALMVCPIMNYVTKC